MKVVERYAKRCEELNGLKVLFVCTGNTCRSPMAEALFRLGSKSHEAYSCGLATEHGHPASPYAIEAVAELGADLKAHCSRQASAQLVAEADLILTMTEGHKRWLRSHFPEAQERIYTLREYVDEEGEVADPFGGTAAVYRQTAKQLAELIEKLQKKLELKDK